MQKRKEEKLARQAKKFKNVDKWKGKIFKDQVNKLGFSWCQYSKIVRDSTPRHLKEQGKHLAHLFSVAAGFFCNVPVGIINHPCNLELQSEEKNMGDGAICQISLEELLSRIQLSKTTSLTGN